MMTRGQQIVSDYERDIIAEPCELAEAIDKELGLLAGELSAIKASLRLIRCPYKASEWMAWECATTNDEACALCGIIREANR